MNCYQPDTASQIQGLRVTPQPLPENGSNGLLRALFERGLDAVGRPWLYSVRQ